MSIMRTFLSLTFTFALINCKNRNDDRNGSHVYDSIAQLDRSGKKIDLESTNLDTAGFLSTCPQLIAHASLGALQGVNAQKDSLQNIYFSACYDCNTTYELLFVHKNFEMRRNKEYSSLSKEFMQGCEDYFKNFNCFAFVCHIRDPDKQKDVHAMNIDFPTTVKVFERKSGDNWNLIRTFRAKSFGEYARLQFTTIYHLGD